MSFGGGSSTQNVSLLTRDQKKNLKALNSYLQTQIGSSGPVFDGQRVAETSPLQQQAFDAFGQLGGQLNNLLPQALQGFTAANQSLQQQLQPFDPTNTTNFFNTSIKDPSVRAFQQDIVPGISERFAGKNALRSGAFGRTLARAGSDLSSNLGAQLGNLLFQGEQAHLNRQNQAAGQLASQSLLPAQLANPLMQLGGLQRGITQQGLSANQSRFLEGLPSNNPALALLGPALNTQAFQPVVTQQSDPFGSAMGALGTAGGAFLGTEAGA